MPRYMYSKKGSIPYCAIKFMVFERLKNNHYLSQKTRVNTKLENFVNGGIAALITISITHPTDVIRRVSQMNVIQKFGVKHSYWDSVQELWKSEGLAGFYKGLPMTYVKVIPSIGLSFMINEYMKSLLGVSK